MGRWRGALWPPYGDGVHDVEKRAKSGKSPHGGSYYGWLLTTSGLSDQTKPTMQPSKSCWTMVKLVGLLQTAWNMLYYMVESWSGLHFSSWIWINWMVYKMTKFAYEYYLSNWYIRLSDNPGRWKTSKGWCIGLMVWVRLYYFSCVYQYKDYIWVTGRGIILYSHH